MGEDPLLERAQLRPGFQPKLAVERIAAFAIGRERVGLATALVQRQHQLPQQPLAVGVRGDQRLQLADQTTVITEHQVGVDAILERA